MRARYAVTSSVAPGAFGSAGLLGCAALATAGVVVCALAAWR